LVKSGPTPQSRLNRFLKQCQHSFLLPINLHAHFPPARTIAPTARSLSAGAPGWYRARVASLPSPIAFLTARLPARHRAAGGEFLRFGLVGALGFCLDVAFVYALIPSLGLYGAGAVAYFIVASINWALNRLWTFSDRTHRAAHTQWLRFLAVNLLGFILNRGAYSLLLALFVLPRHYPILAVAAGAASGFLINFLLSRRLVFG
jgi:putative flippase GtrA